MGPNKRHGNSLITFILHHSMFGAREIPYSIAINRQRHRRTERLLLKLLQIAMKSNFAAAVGGINCQTTSNKNYMHSN